MIILTDIMQTPFAFYPYEIVCAKNSVVLRDTQHARAAIVEWKELKQRPVIRIMLDEAIERLDTLPTMRDLVSTRFAIEVLAMVQHVGPEPWPDLPVDIGPEPGPPPEIIES